MSLNWTATVSWLMHVMCGGGLILLVAYLLMRWVRQPARRQWLGDWGLAAALVLVVASLIGPTWLVLKWSQKPSPQQKAKVLFTPQPEFLPEPGGAPNLA